MSRYSLRCKGSENLNIPSFVVMPNQGTPSNSTEGQEEQIQNLYQELLQEKDEEIAALRERIGEERRRHVDKDDELEAMREKLSHMERQRDRQEVSVHPDCVPQLPPSNFIPQTADRLNVRLEKFNGKTSTVVGQIHGPSESPLIDGTTSSTLPTILSDRSSRAWFNTLDATVKASLTAIHTAFINRFKPVSHHAFDLLNFTHGDTGSVEEFIHRVSPKATDMKADVQKMMGQIMNGLKPKIRTDLIRHNPTTMEELSLHRA